MKKLISGALAILFLFTPCFTFVACGGDETNGDVIEIEIDGGGDKRKIGSDAVYLSARQRGRLNAVRVYKRRGKIFL